MYTEKQVYEATLKYFNGDDLATKVWMSKYCLKQKEINSTVYFELTPNDMHWRLAREFARIEAKYPNPMDEKEIYHLLADFKYIVPQGSPMAGIGNTHSITSLSNCFVIGGHLDSYGGIMKADEEQAQLMKRRGGVGQDISYIRPSGSMAGGAPLGPNAGTILYMERFSNTTKEVQQDGRRGALMLSIDIKHPDAESFIDKKMEENKVTGANVSVKISDEFMECLEAGIPFIQTFPIDISVMKIVSFNAREMKTDVLYNGEIVDGVQTYYKIVDPQKIWSKIVHNAWKAAEPGILFWDNILSESPAAGYGLDWRETSTNPCGEIPLNPYDSCRLILINLYSYASNKFSTAAMLEDTLLTDHTKKAMRLMDDLVDLETEKIDAILESIKGKKVSEEYKRNEIELWTKIREKALNGRRTGLGITGEADLIASFGMKYGTEEATEFSEKLHQLIATAAYEGSIELAEERGAFPIHNYNEIEHSDFLKRMFSSENQAMAEETLQRYWEFGRRNIGLLTIAPAGSVSLLTQTSSGIEPIFSFFHYRKRKVTDGEAFDYQDGEGEKWVEYPVFHRPFIEWYSMYKEISFSDAEQILVECNKDTLRAIFKHSPYFEATSEDVDYLEKVRMQGAVQKWVDHSISVTVNMPEDVTEDLVNSVYLQAYKSGCKGITVYRDNSRGNVLSTTSVKDVVEEDSFEYVEAVKRPREVECDVIFKQVKGQVFIVFVGKVKGKPYEIFAVPFNKDTKISKKVVKGSILKIGKGHYKFISKSKKYTIDNICDHMLENEQNETRTISGMLRHKVNPKYIMDMLGKFATISSFHKIIEKVVALYVEEGSIKCPECSSSMTMTEGCMKCTNCGYAHCG